MSLRLLDDDDDSLAANHEDPREDLGYGYRPDPEPHPTLEPRGRGRAAAPLFFTVAEKPDCRPEERGGTIGGAHVCRTCHEPTPILHAIGDDPRRLYCGKCQGTANRERIGWGSQGAPR